MKIEINILANYSYHYVKIDNLSFLLKKPVSRKKVFLVYDKYLKILSVVKPEKLVRGEEENLLLEPSNKDFKDFLPNFFKYLAKLEEKKC